METFPELKRLFVKTPMDKIKLKDKNKVFVEMSDFPPEFHFHKEIRNLEEYVKIHFQKLLVKLAGKIDE